LPKIGENTDAISHVRYEGRAPDPCVSASGPRRLGEDLSSSARCGLLSADRSDDLDHRGSDDHRDHRGQDEEHQWKQNLDRGLLRLLFGAQAPARAQRVRARVKRGSDLRAQLLALDQGRGQRLDIVDRGPIGKAAQRSAQGCAGGDIARDQAEFGADLLPLPLAFGADDPDCFIEPE